MEIRKNGTRLSARKACDIFTWAVMAFGVIYVFGYHGVMFLLR